MPKIGNLFSFSASVSISGWIFTARCGRFVCGYTFTTIWFLHWPPCALLRTVVNTAIVRESCWCCQNSQCGVNCLIRNIAYLNEPKWTQYHFHPLSCNARDWSTQTILHTWNPLTWHLNDIIKSYGKAINQSMSLDYIVVCCRPCHGWWKYVSYFYCMLWPVCLERSIHNISKCLSE